MLDSEKAMQTFLNLIASEPDVARLPIMIDSSKWSVIEAGLRCVQGKAIVNSISLKEGEDVFIEQAQLVRATAPRSSSWPSTSRVRPIRSNARSKSADAVTDPDRRVGFDPADIIFDPNIFAVATGIEEHRATVSISSRRRADQGRVARRWSAAALATCRSRSAATTSCAKPSTRYFCITRSAPAWTWASSMRVSSRSTTTCPRTARCRRRRRAESPRRCDRTAARRGRRTQRPGVGRRRANRI